MSQKKPETPFATKLNEGDQQRVDDFTSSGINRTERKPFRPWVLIMWLTLTIILLGATARIIGLFYLPY